MDPTRLKKFALACFVGQLDAVRTVSVERVLASGTR